MTQIAGVTGLSHDSASPKNGTETGKTYKGGPGHPPREHQFSSTKQLKSNGRPKGSVSIKAELLKLLATKLKGDVNPLDGLTEKDIPVGRKIALSLIAKPANEKVS